MFAGGADILQTVLEQERGAVDVPAEVVADSSAESIPVELFAAVHSGVHFGNLKFVKRGVDDVFRPAAENLPGAGAEKLRGDQ
jgi:hypothetical protein